MKTLMNITERERIINGLIAKVKEGSMSTEDYLPIFVGVMMNPDDDKEPKYLHDITIKDGHLEFTWGDAINVLGNHPVVKKEEEMTTEELSRILDWLNLPDSFPFHDKETNHTTRVWQHDLNFLAQIVGKHDILKDLTLEDEDGEITCTEEELRQVAATGKMTHKMADDIQCRMHDYIDEDDYDTSESLAMTISIYDIKAFIIPIIQKKYNPTAADCGI